MTNSEKHVLDLIKKRPSTKHEICKMSDFTDYQTKLAIKILERDLKIIESTLQQGKYFLFTF